MKDKLEKALLEKLLNNYIGYINSKSTIKHMTQTIEDEVLKKIGLSDSEIYKKKIMRRQKKLKMILSND